VDDAFVVRGGEGIGEGGCDLEDPLDLEPALGDETVERLTRRAPW